MGDLDWRPPIGTRIRAPGGRRFHLVAHYDNENLGPFIVLKHVVPGGWSLRPVTHREWIDRGFEMWTEFDVAAGAPRTAQGRDPP